MDFLLEYNLNKVKNSIKKNSPVPFDSYGKLIRSKIGILLLGSANIEVDEKYLKLFCSTELIHNASLFHDDVIDNSKIRRAPNISMNQAILYGNILSSNAIKILCSLNINKITELYAQTINKMCKGELLQNSQIGIIPEIEQYIEKNKLKTAALFKAMTEGIYILSDKKFNHEITHFGENFGIAFQIKNDLDNVLTDKSDIKNGIYTAPVIYSGSINITNKSIEKTVGLIDNYTYKAINALSELRESIYKDYLIEVVECLKK